MMFREKVGWRPWAAILIGLIGVIIAFQPGADSFSILSILAITGMLGFAERELANRIAPATLATSVVGFCGLLTVMVAGVLYSAWQSSSFSFPVVWISIQLIGSIAAGLTACSYPARAMRTGQVFAVTLFRCTRMPFGITHGVLLFGERVGFPMVFGCNLSVASGLFILWHGTSSVR